MSTRQIRRTWDGEGCHRYHVLELGRGLASLVMFPAIGDSASSYRDIMTRLAEPLDGVMRIIAVDPPGYGRAVLPGGTIPGFSDMMAWAQSLWGERPGPVFFLGNSSGGAMATAAAVATPGSTKGLILMNWPDWRVAELPTATLIPADASELEFLLQQSWHSAPTVAPHMADILLKRYQSQHFRDHVLSLDPGEVHSYYEQYSGPMLFIGGQSDGLVPPDALHKSVARREHATLCLIEDCGHFPHRERSEILAEILVDFIKKHFV